MSTEQTDAHWDNQHRMFIEFDALVSRWLDGVVDYDEVEESLVEMEEDPDVDPYTYEKCVQIWNEAKADESFWQKEELLKWRGLEEDSGEVY